MVLGRNFELNVGLLLKNADNWMGITSKTYFGDMNDALTLV